MTRAEYQRRYRASEKGLESVRRNNRSRAAYLARLKYRRGLTADQYDKLLISQSGRCAICRKPMRTPHIDHDHATGKVRGLLCVKCNLGLGQFDESVLLLEQAIRYLR